jgi:hypothetical protein
MNWAEVNFPFNFGNWAHFIFSFIFVTGLRFICSFIFTVGLCQLGWLNFSLIHPAGPFLGFGPPLMQHLIRAIGSAPRSAHIPCFKA